MSHLSRCVLCAGLMVIALATACSRPSGSVPFAQGTSSSAVDADTVKAAEPDSALPFHDMSNLPPGTLVTVRLNNAIAADRSIATWTFEAVVDEPIVVDGVALVPRGAYAAGCVESARRSKVERDRGYVRLTLASIDVFGHDIPVQTSSLFASATMIGVDSSAERGDINPIRLEKGRRLTFRLTGPVQVPREQHISSR